MRILVFSDTHGTVDRAERLTRLIPEVSLILHAGDGIGEAEELKRLFPRIPVEYVRGNCDFSNAPSIRTIEAEKKKILLTHGHCYSVKEEKDHYFTLTDTARRERADIAVFGHTHLPYNEHLGDFILFNPGSLTYGRTYGVIEIEAGTLRAAVCDAPF